MCLDKALNKALEDCVSKEDTVICFPTLHGNSWFFDGSGDWDYGVAGTFVKREYWDLRGRKRTVYETDDCISISIFQLLEQSNLKEIIGDKNGYYFYLPGVVDVIYKSIVENMCLMEEKIFEYAGWKIYRVQFSNREENSGL